MDSIKLLKNTLRKQMKQQLQQLTPIEQQLQSKIVTEKLLQLPEYQQSSRISVYLSTDNEISTTEILKNIFDYGKKCFVPRYSGDKMEMVLLKSMQDYNELPVTKWNIRQPRVNEIRDEALNSGGLDLVIVPGVAFTANGDRLGHGKGYYDKYLSSCSSLSKPFIVALAFKEQILSEIPTIPTDFKIDLVLSP